MGKGSAMEKGPVLSGWKIKEAAGVVKQGQEMTMTWNVTVLRAALSESLERRKMKHQVKQFTKCFLQETSNLLFYGLEFSPLHSAF